MSLYIGTQKVKPSGISKIYIGNTLVYEATTGPRKGDIISFDAFGDSTQKRFRVLAISGSTAKLLALDPYVTGTNNVAGGYSAFDNGNIGGKYAGSNLDTLVNTTYYNALSATVRNAIVASTNIIQTAWNYINWESSTTDSRYLNQQKANGKYYQAEKKDQTTISSRNVYVMDVNDLCEYFGVNPVGGVVVKADIDTLFETTNVSNQLLWPWFISTRTFGSGAGENPQAYYWHHNNGWIESVQYEATNNAGKKAVLPIFKINLSQIEYTIE